MAYRNQQAQEMLGRWVEWLKTRRRYVPQPKDTPLTTMMAGPKKSRVIEPDWDNDQEASYFHLALMSIPENKRLCFLRVYGDFDELRKPVKYWCHELGEISRETFYTWAHESAAQVVARSKRMQKESQVNADNIVLTLCGV